MRVYGAWLSSEEHSAFTGSRAECEHWVGGRFSSWEGYISGTHRELLEGRLIVQNWRTTEFPRNHPDSIVTVHFDPNKEGTQLTILHTEIPEGQGRDYEGGWFKYYLEPLQKYFGKGAGPKGKAAAKKPVAKRAAAKKAAFATKAGAKRAAGNKKKPKRS